jgi:uncharacterized protein YjbI with pentapeptide repeats
MDLILTKFNGSTLVSANFTRAVLTYAELEDADISGAMFRGAKMPDGSIHP